MNKNKDKQFWRGSNNEQNKENLNKALKILFGVLVAPIILIVGVVYFAPDKNNEQVKPAQSPIVLESENKCDKKFNKRAVLNWINNYRKKDGVSKIEVSSTLNKYFSYFINHPKKDIDYYDWQDNNIQQTKKVYLTDKSKLIDYYDFNNVCDLIDNLEGDYSKQISNYKFDIASILLEKNYFLLYLAETMEPQPKNVAYQPRDYPGDNYQTDSEIYNGWYEDYKDDRKEKEEQEKKESRRYS